jgi:hypothetical protein
MHVPIALSGTDAVPAGTGVDRVRLGLLPGRELDEVYVGLSRYDERADQYVSIRHQTPLGYGYYPAGRMIAIALERPPAPGPVVVQIGGTFGRGGSTSREFWILWPAG